jgi:hypothetical protein
MSRGGAFRLFGGWMRSHFEPLPISGDLGSLSGVWEVRGRTRPSNGPRVSSQVGLRAPVAVGARPRAAGRPLPSSSQLSSAQGSGMDFEVHSYLRAGSVPTPAVGVPMVGSKHRPRPVRCVCVAARLRARAGPPAGPSRLRTVRR